MKAPNGAQVHIFPDVPSLAGAFAREQAARIKVKADAFGKAASFSLALTGGKTPAPLYRHLNDPEFRQTTPWQTVKIFFGDERAVPPTDPASNFKLAWDNWLSTSPVPRASIFRMEGDDPDLNIAADLYSEILNREVPSGSGGFPELDLLHLGLGEDGHTASLFPGSPALDETMRLVTVNEIPVSGEKRLTLTYPTINSAREIWFLIVGSNKAERVAQCLHYISGGETLPASLVHSPTSNIHWWLDSEAASLIPAEAAREQ